MDNNKNKTILISKNNKKIILAKEFKEQKFVSIKISSSIEIIDKEAFLNCHKLKYVYFEKGSKLKRISEYAFLGCSSLEYIDLPASLKSIEFNAFGGTKILKNISEYKGCKYVGSKTNPYLMLYESKNEKEKIVVHKKTKYILNSAFLDDQKIKHITLNKSLIQIGEYAFDGCINLKSIRIKENHNLKVILDNAFDNCMSLSNIYLKKQTISINKDTIKGFILKNK